MKQDFENLPDYAKQGTKQDTNGLPPEEILRALSSYILSYRLNTGQASSDPKFRDYTSELAKGEAFDFIQSLAEEEKRDVGKLIKLWKSAEEKRLEGDKDTLGALVNKINEEDEDI